MAQAMLRLLARPKITAVFCASVIPRVSKSAVLQPRRYKIDSNAVEGFLNFLYRIAQNDRAAVRATHRAIRFCERSKQPFHLGLIERHIDFDSRVARGGGGDFGLQRVDGDGCVFT